MEGCFTCCTAIERRKPSKPGSLCNGNTSWWNYWGREGPRTFDSPLMVITVHSHTSCEGFATFLFYGFLTIELLEKQWAMQSYTALTLVRLSATSRQLLFPITAWGYLQHCIVFCISLPHKVPGSVCSYTYLHLFLFSVEISAFLCIHLSSQKYKENKQNI